MPRRSAALPAVPEAQRLTLVILVDDANLSQQGRARALPALETFLRASLGPTDRAIVAVEQGADLKVRLPPPGDVPAVLAALREITTRMARGTHPPTGATRVAVAFSDELGGRESVMVGSFDVGGRAAPGSSSAAAHRRPAAPAGPPPRFGAPPPGV